MTTTKVIDIVFANKPRYDRAGQVIGYNRSGWLARFVQVIDSRVSGQLFYPEGGFEKNFDVKVKDNKFSVSIGSSGCKINFTLPNV